jgi:glycosyltransferase involved in cell wall biosynthesis
MSSEPATAANPYFRLFYGALHALGVEFAGTFVPSRRWLRANRDAFDVLHFHWPEWLIRSEPDSLRFFHSVPGGWRINRLLRPAFPIAQIYEYRKFLQAARALGKRIVWTCHNVEPHETATWPVRAAFRSLARCVDLVICHDEAAGARCRDLYAPRGSVVVMEHGNYDGVYPPPRPKDAVLREIGLAPSAPLVLCVGQIRPYKGTDLVCEAVSQLGDRVSLLIAGHTPIAHYARRIKDLVEQLPNAAFIDKHLTEQEFADYVAASDLVLLPYRSVTGSGAALAALTLGRGVVASDLSFFVDLLRGHPGAGRVFARGDAGAMARAIEDFLAVSSAERERAALDLAAKFDWARLVPPVAAKLRELVADP